MNAALAIPKISRPTARIDTGRPHVSGTSTTSTNRPIAHKRTNDRRKQREPLDLFRDELVRKTRRATGFAPAGGRLGVAVQRPLRLRPWFRGDDALPQFFEVEANRCMRSYQVAENFVSIPDGTICRAAGPRERATDACARAAAAWPRGTRAPCLADSHPRSGALDRRSAAARRAARATGA